MLDRPRPPTGVGINLSTRTPLEQGLIAAIADHLPVGIFVATAPSGAFVYANDAFQEILGMGPTNAQAGRYSPSYGIHTHDGALYPEDRLPFARALREKASVTVDDIVIHRGDGTKVFVRAFARPLADPHGVITHVIIAFIDISEEIRTRSRAVLAEGHLQHVLAHAPIILFAYDREGIVTLTEGRGLDSLGFRPKELLGRSVFELYANEPRVRSHARRVLAGEEFREVTQVGPVVLETTFSPIRGANGEVEGAIGVSLDVTERAKAQSRLVEAERLASMGTLSATVAHEINNPLTYILGSLELAADRLSGPAAASTMAREVAGNVEDAREGADRVRRIVRGLQAFARADDDRAEPTDVIATLERALEMTDNAIRHRARLVRNLTRVPPVLANDLRLGQVFVNLLMNASQAIPEGHADTNEIRVRSSHDKEKAEVIVAIEDTGSGIAPDLQARIFEPFFTTKPLGVGNGLGLSICHGIVEGFGGSIELESVVGRGTTFRVRLKESMAPPASGVAKSPNAPHRPLRRGRLLIVDDDKKVARSLELLLQGDHDVEVSTEPRAVAERILAGERFDVILCDLMMPVMTGMDLHALVADHAPEQAQRFVFVTGGAFTPAADAFIQRVENIVLQKPYDLEKLQAALTVHLNR
jgi:PAS domain S-box-containing protein